jgi:glyceraldehyde-3-phosphate dehydrogenase (arsenate-transferring)
MRVGINGLGRIGRLALRAAMGGVLRGDEDPRANGRLEVVHANELKGGAGAAAHLLEFDSVHGRWRERIGFEDDSALVIGNHRIGFTSAARPGDVPWGDLGCDIVLECTGKFLRQEALQGYFDRGVKRVIVAAPVKDGSALNVVVGVNDRCYDPGSHRLLTAASCTTNCLAPVVKVVHEAIGIRHGQITTIHAPTNTNVVVDAPHKDLRRARSAMLSLQPTTTGSDFADLPGAQGTPERARRPRPYPERLSDRLRLRNGAGDHTDRGERTVPVRGRGIARGDPGLRGPAAGLGGLRQ